MADGPGDRPERTGPRVFVSYAHDDERHRDAVRELAEFLTHRGIWVDLDMWYGGSRQDWAAWAMRCLTSADYILVIASPKYSLVGDGDGADEHRGVQYEAEFLRDRLYGDVGTWRRKVLPVVLPGHTLTELPAFLHPYTNTHFIIPTVDDNGLDALLRIITKQPRDPRPPLGRIPPLPPGRDAPADGVLDRLDRMDSVLAEVRATEREARRWPAAGEPDIVAAPRAADRARDLQTRVTMLRTVAWHDPTDSRLLDRLRARESTVDDALDAARDVRDRREALWGEWAELRRKLRTYRARTLPALAEDVELTRLYDIGHGRLWHDPCDLAATRTSVEDYVDAVRRRTGIVPAGDGP